VVACAAAEGGDVPSLRDPADLDGLRSQLPGQVSIRGEEGHSAATPWDLSVAVEPAAVVAATRAADVAAVLRFAADQGWRVAVQATGHGAVPLSDDSLLVHTGRLQECLVDPASRSVRFGAGVTWQSVLDATTPHGLAAVCGSSVNVGAVGYLTGGGIGPLSRPCGKSYLGIVTAVEFGLLPIAELYGGSVFFDGVELASVLPAWRDWATDLPATADTSIAIMQMPSLPQVPAPLAGRMTVPIRYADLAPTAQAEQTLAPMLAVAESIFGGTGVIPYAHIGGVHNDPVAPAPTGHTTALLAALPDQAIAEIVSLAGPGSGSPQTLVEIRQLGGALAEPLGVPSAFTGGRRAA
jgi:hypothetical protein